MSKRLKIVAAGFAALIFLVFATLLFFSSRPGESLVRSWLEGELSAQLGLPVRIGEFETNLWSRVRIDSLAVGSLGVSSDRPHLYIGRIRIHYSIFGLLEKPVSLKALTIDSVTASVVRDETGRYGLPLLDSSKTDSEASGGATASIHIDTVSLDKLGLSFFDEQIPLSLSLTGAVLSAQGGRDGSYSGRLAVDNISITHDSVTLDLGSIDLAASLDSASLHLDSAEADCAGVHLAADGALALADPKDIAFNLSASGSSDTLASQLVAMLDLPAISAAELDIQAHIKGTVEDPQARVDAELRDLTIRELVCPSSRFEATYENDQIQVDSFQVETLDGKLYGHARTSLDSLGTSSVELAAENIDLGSLWRLIYDQPSPYQGSVGGRMAAQGNRADLTSWKVEAAVTGRNLSYANRSIPPLQATIKTDGGRARLSLVHGDDNIQADIEFGNDSLNGSFTVALPDLSSLARLLDQPELSGHIVAHGSVSGAYTNPAGRASIDGTGVTFRRFPLDSLSAELDYADSNLNIVDFSCRGQLDSIDPAAPTFDLDSIGGSFAYSCRLKGSLSRLSGDVTFRADKPSYGSYALDSLSMEAALDGSLISVTRLRALYGGVAALLSATYDTSSRSGAFDLELRPVLATADSARPPDGLAATAVDHAGSVTGKFSLGSRDDLSATIEGRGLWLGLVPLLTGDTALSDGYLDFNLAADGPYYTPELSLDATTRSIKASGYVVDSVSAHAKVIERQLTVDSVRVDALGHTLFASVQLGLDISPDGWYKVGRNAEVTAELSTRDFDLSIVPSLVGPELEIAGLLSASVQVAGTVASPRFKGWLITDSGRVRLAGESPPVENLFLSLLFADSVLTIDSAVADISGAKVRAEGSLVTAPAFDGASVDLKVGVGRLGRLAAQGSVSKEELRLQVRSDSLNIAVFEPFVPEIDSLRGRLHCHISVSGTMTAPEIDGSLKVSSLNLRAPRHGLVVSEGHADVRFDKSRVVLDSAGCLLNGGTLILSGALEHDRGNLSDIGLTLRARAVTLREPENYVVTVDSAGLTYGRRQENYVLSGDIFLGEARLTARLRLTSLLPWVQSVETVDMELPDLLARSRFDVRIRESNQLWVDNNLAHLRLRAELGVIGTFVRPNFTGLIQAEEGYLLYLDRRFRVTEGTVYFNDPARFNPDINLNASTDVTVYRRTAAQHYTVYIKAQGLLDQLQYGLYSEPPLEKPDIVALLTLGATRSELAGENQNGGGLSGALKDRAEALTSQRVSGYLSRRAGSLFGFDEFTIQGNLFKFDNSWGPQLVASKRLSKQVEVTYSTTVGHLNDQSVRLGYRLTPRWSLQGETDRQGRAGLDLKYALRFR